MTHRIGPIGAAAEAVPTDRPGAFDRPGALAERPPARSSAITTTTARYAKAPLVDRVYVATKLRVDPLTRVLVEDGRALGDVLDVGCGRGQFGLLLRDLGRVRSLRGYDWDARKVRLARAAAEGAADFFTADVREAPPAAADTILLFDVLQYLSAAEESRLLRALVAALRPGGRLWLRVADRSRGLRARLSQALDHLARAVRLNRSRCLAFRSSAELERELHCLGLRLTPAPRGSSWLLDNRIWVAEAEASGAERSGLG